MRFQVLCERESYLRDGQSPEDKIRATAAALSPELHWAITDAKTAQAFGDITSVPTMFLFDRSGKTMKVLYGAPPDLHQQAEKTLDAIVKSSRGKIAD